MEQLHKSSLCIQIFIEVVLTILVKLREKAKKQVKTNKILVTTKIGAYKNCSTIKLLNWQGFRFE